MLLLLAITDITEDTFNAFTQDGNNVVKFYSPYCGHCRLFKKQFVALEGLVPSDIKLAQLDCSKFSSLCKGQNLRGYPTTVLYKDGEQVSRVEGNFKAKEVWRKLNE